MAVPGGGDANRLTFLVVKYPEGVSVLVTKELTNNDIRIFLYQAVISEMSRYKWELQVSRVSVKQMLVFRIKKYPKLGLVVAQSIHRRVREGRD